MATLHSPHRSPVVDNSEHDLNRQFEHNNHHGASERPSSIDMALRLEHELDAEHEEPGDGDADGHVRTHEPIDDVNLNDAEAVPGKQEEGGDANTNTGRPVSLDPLVLAGIVANLRADLSRVTQERDALADTLHNAPSKEAELREALALLNEKCQELEREVDLLRKKGQDDEDAIHMLRTKVEESRRGLMRLQTESKRMSQMSMSIDTSRANSFLPISGAPSSSKRASFVPLTGSGAVRIQSHRRISSVSDPSFHGGVADDATAATIDATSLRLSPGAQTASFPDDASSSAEAKKARRSSAFFSLGRAPDVNSLPPPVARSSNPDVSFTSDSSISEELEALRNERNAARMELLAAKQDLSEAQEAREASEQCVAALRAFISEQGAGTPSGLLKLPPLPTDKSADSDNHDAQQKNKAGFNAGGWSFGKLFRQDSSGASASGRSGSPSRAPSAITSPAVETAPAPPAVTTPPTAQTNTQSPTAASGAAALSRKIGGFFSARAPSISSVASAASESSAGVNSYTSSTPIAATTPVVRPPAAHGQQEPTLNGMGSDDEDDGPPEPLSPVRDHDAVAPVVVRAASTSASSVADVPTEERDIVSLGGKAIAYPEPIADEESPSLL